MSRRSQAPKAALLLQGLLIALWAAAAPVLQSDEATPAQPGLPAALGGNPPSTSSLMNSGAAAPGDDSKSGASDAASDTWPALGTSQEGGARSRALGAGQPALAGTKPGAARPPAAADGAEIDPDLRDAAKAALELAHEIKEMVVQPAGLDGSDQDPTAASRAASGSTVRTLELSGPFSADSEPSVIYLPPAQSAIQSGRATSAEMDLVREAIKQIKEVVEHPATLMLLPLVALGFAAMWVVQYRAMVDRRRGRRRSAHGRRGDASKVEGGRRRPRHTTEAPPAASASKATRPRSRHKAKESVTVPR